MRSPRPLSGEPLAGQRRGFGELLADPESPIRRSVVAEAGTWAVSFWPFRRGTTGELLAGPDRLASCVQPSAHPAGRWFGAAVALSVHGW